VDQLDATSIAKRANTNGWTLLDCNGAKSSDASQRLLFDIRVAMAADVYADYIAENEGGKQAPLIRPAAQSESARNRPASQEASNVVPLFGRRRG
jgi:hypothetical protein